MRKANHSECVEYFDKKRDLMLGSAPTDVLTAVASLIASGVAIGVADTKEDNLNVLCDVVLLINDVEFFSALIYKKTEFHVP